MSEFLLKVKASGTEEFAKNAKETADALNRADASASKMAGKLNELSKHAGLFVRALSASAIIKWAHATIQAAQAVTDLSDRTGIARQELAALSYAADATNTPVQVLIASFEALAKAQGDIQAGIGRTAERIKAFEKLGITLADLQKKSPQQLFTELTARMKEGAITSEQMSAGIRLMGESFKDLIPAAKDGLSDLVKEFEGSWAKIDEGTSSYLDNMGANLDKFWAKAKAGGKKFSADLISSIVVGVTAIMNLELKKLGLFFPKAAAVAEEVDTDIEITRMGGDGSREVDEKTKKLADQEAKKESRNSIEQLKNQIKSTLGDDAEDVLEELGARSAKKEDYERALRQAKRRKAREAERLANREAPKAPSVDALQRIGGFSQALVKGLENPIKEQLKVARKMEQHLNVIKGELSGEIGS